MTLDALTVAADGAMATVAKPMKGLGPGIFEVALKYGGDAFRLVYAVAPHDDLWIIHAFQKKSTRGIRTPKHEIELIRNRLRRLKEALR
jgi:phage-related protein